MRWRRKQQGDATVVSAMICNCVGIFVFYAMVTLLLDYSHALDTKNAIYTVCDSYLQGMMADGYLTQEKQEQLTAELEALGAANPDYSGSTLSCAEYGDRIRLKVSFELMAQVHGITGLFATEVEDGSMDTGYDRSATSYH